MLRTARNFIQPFAFIVTGVVVSFGAITYIGTLHLDEKVAWVKHTEEVVGELNREIFAIEAAQGIAAEGSGGTTALGGSKLLREFLATADQQNRRLLDLTRDNPSQHSRFNEIAGLLREGPALARAAELANEALSAERALLDERSAELKDELGSLRADVIGGCLLAGALFSLGAWTLLRELKRRTEIERDLRLATEEALRAKGAERTFLANMSHEIRTPLNAIVGAAELLSGTPQSSVQSNYTKILSRAANTLLQLITDVLDLSKVDAGALDIREEPCSVSEVIEESCELLSFRASRKGISIGVEIDSQLPAWIVTDASRVKQVLLNLISNAIKFTPEEGSIVVQADLSGSEAAPRVRFCVKDSGIGMTEEERSAIFSRFKQANDTIGPRFGGTGLGLAISKQIVERLGGEIGCASVLAEGSSFYFEIDLKVPEESLEDGPSHLIQLESARKLRVLIVDDVDDNRLLTGMYLGSEGHEAQFASNGSEALAKFRAEPFDLVLIDVHMPLMNGYEATMQMRQWERETGRAPIPIFAVTAYAMTEDREKSMAAGCTDHLTKPLKKEELLKRIRGLAARSHAAPSDDPSSCRYVVTLKPQMKELIPAFMKNRKSDIAGLRGALETADFAELDRLAHRLKGVAGSFGFPFIASVAAKLQSHASSQDAEAAKETCSRLESYFDRLEVRFDEGAAS